MFSGGLLVVICLIYIGLLFLIAWLADRYKIASETHKAWVYSLSLAVYCTSWTLYGVIGQAATQGWSFIGIYLGPIVVFLFFSRWLKKIIHIAQQKRITSIADFVSARYGRAHALSGVVTLIALLATIPYIALQLRAVSSGFDLLTNYSHTNKALPFYQDSAFYVGIFMMLFAITFGTRIVEATDKHQGLIAAVAFESFVKLVVFLCIGFWLCFFVFDSPQEIILLSKQEMPSHALWTSGVFNITVFTQSLMAAFAVVLLPRQFQVMVIENQRTEQMNYARWIMPIYLLLMVAMVVPIALSGQILIGEASNPDDFLINIPLSLNQPLLAFLAFIGGASAATSMIIVATLAVSTMLSNEWLLPVLFRKKGTYVNFIESENVSVKKTVLMVRRLAILFIVLFAYVFYRFVGDIESLSAMGLLSFAAITQCAPALIGGMVWQKGNRHGALAGLIVGIGLWFYTLLIPILMNQPISYDSLLGQLFYKNAPWDDFTTSSLLCLTANFLVYVFVSSISDTSVRERMAAGDFLSKHSADNLLSSPEFFCKVDDLRAVMERVIGVEKTHEFMQLHMSYYEIKKETETAPKAMLSEAESILASAIGASSTRVIFSTLLGKEHIDINDIATLASETHQAVLMNRNQLQAALENLHQGVSIIDENMKLVAWNQRYLEIYDFPENYIRVGLEVEEIIRFNSQRGLLGKGSTQEHIARRMKHLREGLSHEYEREMPNGTVIFMQGRLMPNGGYVTSFTDITAYKHAANKLKQTNLVLEKRVTENTQELAKLTSELIDVSTNKTRFLAATSHDLIQPVNAAKLFAATLAQKNLNPEQMSVLNHLEGALNSAEEVLGVLVEVSKLDAGVMKPKFKEVEIYTTLQPLVDEMTALANAKGLRLRYRKTQKKLWVHTDPQWLKRILQNLLSNAIHYTDKGSVLLSARAGKHHLKLQVWDTGVGISEENLPKIFEEFNRLNQTKNNASSLGLGLAIVSRMSQLLDQPISVKSKLGSGSCFTLTLPLTQAPSRSNQATDKTALNVDASQNMHILCIDDDLSVLKAMQVLLESWQYKVLAYSSMQDIPDDLSCPSLLIVDYQLDDGDTGIEVLTALRRRWGNDIDGVLVSASIDPELADKAKQAGLYYLRKPIKPAALRALLRTLTV